MIIPRKLKLQGALLGAVLLLGACAAPPLQIVDGNVSEEGLQRLGGTAFDEVWARPGVDLRQFQLLAVEQATIDYRDVEDGIRERSLLHRSGQTAFAIPEDERQRIERLFQRRLSESLERSSQFRYSPTVVPGALMVRASLVDYVSRAPREDRLPGRSQVWVRSVGEASLIVELWDPERDQLLVRVLDHEVMEAGASRLVRGDSVTSVAEIDRQMQRWARDLRQVVDQLYELGGTGALGRTASRR